jgi:hypothetical protein
LRGLNCRDAQLISRADCFLRAAAAGAPCEQLDLRDHRRSGDDDDGGGGAENTLWDLWAICI